MLQVLALVGRRGQEVGGEAAELGRLAGEQEQALRALVSAAPDAAAGEVDLRALLAAYASPAVTVATPATPVVLPAARARELAARSARRWPTSRRTPATRRARGCWWRTTATRSW